MTKSDLSPRFPPSLPSPIAPIPQLPSGGEREGDTIRKNKSPPFGGGGREVFNFQFSIFNLNKMDLEYTFPQAETSIIKVIGVGGGGCNAVNNMYSKGIHDVSFVVCNTDNKALNDSVVPSRLQLGTDGLGAGNNPAAGRQAAEESSDNIRAMLNDGTKMVFITAGMGGGTGTGAAPVIAKTAKEMDILTIGIVTIPFRWEGIKKIDQALDGVEEMSKNVDALLVINNERLAAVRLKGVVTADPDVIRAMDRDVRPYSIDKVFNQDGSVSKTAKWVLEEDTLRGLMDAAVEKAGELCGRMRSGEIEASPGEDKNGSVCRYCEYRAVCRENGRNGRTRDEGITYRDVAGKNTLRVDEK